MKAEVGKHPYNGWYIVVEPLSHTEKSMLDEVFERLGMTKDMTTGEFYIKEKVK